MEVPINVVLVGSPGDGKTKMLSRVAHLAHVEMLSDVTHAGLIQVLYHVKDNVVGTLVIPDLGTLVGRRGEVADQTVSTLAMMTAEGVQSTRVGRRFREFGGARCSLLSAITMDDLARRFSQLNQNAFLSRTILVNFDLDLPELVGMMRLKHKGNDRLLRPLSFRRAGMRKDGSLPVREIKVAETYARRSQAWWMKLHRQRPDRFFGFRSGDFLTGLLQCAAYMRGAKRVGRIDVDYMNKRILPLIMRQVRLAEPER
jgi:hypothetical protein